jgi:hypothetical protein
MAGVVIDVSIEKGGTSVADDLDQLVSDSGYELVVVHGPRACGPCRANENPHNVPCAECHGNIAGKVGANVADSDDPDADDDKALARGNLCQCRVELRKKADEDFEE